MSKSPEVLKAFVIECGVLLDGISEDIDALEKNADPRERIESMLRGLGTLKNASAFLNFEKLKEVSRTAEAVLKSFRDQQSIGGGTASAFRTALRTLRALHGSILSSQGEGDVDTTAALEALERSKKVGDDTGSASSVELAIEAAERVSTELLLNGRWDPHAVARDLEALEGLCTLEPETAALLRQLAAARGGSEPEIYQGAIDLVGQLIRRLRMLQLGHIEAVPTPARLEPAPPAELLEYDTTVDRDILESFISESATHLESMELKALDLESNPTDSESLDVAFRAMHSLKGLAGFLNFGSFQRITHEAETILDNARKNKQGVTPAGCNLLLRTVDVLREMVRRMAEHSRGPSGTAFSELPPSCRPLLQELTGLVASPQGKPQKNETPPAFPEETPSHPEVSSLAPEQAKLVRVKVEKLDSLLDAIGELVVTQTQVHQDPDLKALDSPRLLRNLGQLRKITRDLQAAGMALRMYPIRDTFARMVRVARDLVHKQGKSAEITVFGEETELDKNVIEALMDPLTHLVRNAVDHGVDMPDERLAAGKPSKAYISLCARYEGDTVVIEVADDGRGLNLSRILEKARQAGLVPAHAAPSDAELQELIFKPGFSTVEKVSEVSGRGVGLDVVRRNVEAAGGTVGVRSTPGQGTYFRLTLPLTLAIIDGLVVSLGSERYVIPLTAVVESFRPKSFQVQRLQGRAEMVEIRGTHLPVVRLSEYCGQAGSVSSLVEGIVVVVEGSGGTAGLLVDDVLGQQQLVIKGLGDWLRGIRGVSGGGDSGGWQGRSDPGRRRGHRGEPCESRDGAADLGPGKCGNMGSGISHGGWRCSMRAGMV